MLRLHFEFIKLLGIFLALAPGRIIVLARLLASIKVTGPGEQYSCQPYPFIYYISTQLSSILRGVDSILADLGFLIKFASKKRSFSQDYNIKRSLQVFAFPTKSTSYWLL